MTDITKILKAVIYIFFFKEFTYIKDQGPVIIEYFSLI